MARGHVKDKKTLGRSLAARTPRVLVIDDHPAVLRSLVRRMKFGIVRTPGKANRCVAR
jgi:hypothetical protein